jgi:hypothetical protein
MWEYLVGVIAEPVQALHDVAEKKLWKESLLLVAVLALLNACLTLATIGPSLSSVQDPTLSRLMANFANPWFLIPAMLVTTSLSWLINGALLYWFSKLMKGTGTLAGMLACTGFAMAPSFLSIPLSALALLLGSSTGSLVGSVAGFVSGMWILVLDLLAIRESQHLDTRPAVGVFLLSVLAIIFLIILIIVLLGIIAGITGLIPGSPPS